MNWLERLNRAPARIGLGQGTAEILHWAYQDPLPDNMPHRHTFFEVCLVGGHGEGLFIVEGRAQPLSPGTVFFARPGVVHQIVNTQTPGMELFWVCFQWNPAPLAVNREVDALLAAFADSPTATVLDEEGRLMAQWRALRALAGSVPRPGYEVQATALVTALLLTIAQSGAGDAVGTAVEPVGPEWGDLAARLAVRYIHDNLARPLALAEIAQQVHASPRHLSRLFQRFTGTSPAAYIVHARMDRARGLLAHGDLPIKEVAVAVGYPDVHHFTRVFAQQAGCPPGEFRRHPALYLVRNEQKIGGLV